MLKTQRNTLHEVICEKFKNRQGLSHRDRGVHHPSPGVSKRLATERQEAMFRLMEVF